MINCKIVKICDIFIHCKVTFKMRTADSGKVPFYNCAENVKMKIIDIIFIFFIFVAEEVENELIFKCLWKQVIKINTFS